MKKTILIILLFIITQFSFSQQLSTKGKDFWLGFMKNCTDSYLSDLSVYISSKQNTSGIISIPGLLWNQNFSVNANSTTKITIPNNAEVKTSGVIENKGIHITTLDTVSVFALNYIPFTSDASIIYPTNTLDREYRILTIHGWPLSLGEEYLIVATDNNTTVVITPTGGAAFTINLNAGQTYQIINPTIGLSGAIVKSVNCKKIAVFSGSVDDNIGGCGAADHLYEQMLPCSRYGRNFITVPLLTKTIDYFKIIAHNDSTSVTINGGTPFMLNAGQTHLFSTGQTSYIQASKPIFGYQYAQGAGCDSVGDPFSVIVMPMEQSITDIVFNAFTSIVITNYYVNIVTHTIDTSLLTLDGTHIPFNVEVHNPIYSYARIAINSGDHHIISPSGFIATVYGFGPAESYGYSAGFSLNNLQNDFTMLPNHPCPNDTVNFSTQYYPNIATYQWLFGDGTTDTGINAKHIYNSINTYNVGLVVTENGGCNVDTIWKTLQVGHGTLRTFEPVICQGDTFNFANHHYTTTGIYVDSIIHTCFDTIITTKLTVLPKQTFSLGNDTTLCDGQQLILNTTNTNAILYQWQDASSSPIYTIIHQGNYWVKIITDSNCFASDTINVIYKPNPIVNLGNDTTLCYGQTITLNAALPNAIYKWQDNSTNSAFTVSPPYTPYIFWVKVTVDNCSSSDTIQIYNYAVPQINLGTNTLLCYGQTILLDVTTNNATYHWQDGSTQATYSVSQKGTYNVKVTDTTTNCSSTASITIKECTKDIVIPNIFTPNGDGFNDYFFIKDAEGWNISIQIYNRWGIKVYEDNNYKNNWNGKDLSDGVYYYIIKVINKDNGIKKEYNGSVTILR